MSTFEIDLEKTKEYKTLDGRRAVIDGEFCGDCAFDHFMYYGRVIEPAYTGDYENHGTACCWSEEGYSREDGAATHSNDLVSAYSDSDGKPVVDWSHFPVYIKYLAMDEDGDWFGYATKPEIYDDEDDAFEFMPSDSEPYGMHVRIKGDHEPDFSGDWKDSLVERPVESYIEIPWEKIPEKYNVVAFDEDGWFAYTAIPEPANHREWDVSDEDLQIKSLSPLSLPDFPGDFRDSIQIRPGTNPKKAGESEW